MMDKDNFLLLVTKVLSGNALPHEETLLQNTLATHPEFLPLYEQYKRYWQQQAVNQTADVEKALAATWQKINQASTVPVEDIGETPVRRFPSWKRMAVAAAVLGIVMTAGWLFFRKPQQPAVEWVETYNPKGIRSSIVLPDGSKVWLAADSKLKYPRHFATTRRELYLEGEAFFEVVRNPQKPFIVQLGKGAVQVLGTSFDISAYKTQQEITTSVATGKVAFIPGTRKSDTVYLTPNKKSVYNTRSGFTEVKETDALADKAWIDGVLLFDAVTLGDIALALERYYGKTVQFRDQRLRTYRYTGKFANRTPAEILNYLSKTKAFAYTVSDSLIVIGR
ncbi:MAG: FecR domain-containing protein [Niastella sp.]|nr:FecR domain-containing protein [Niastella sp.]